MDINGKWKGYYEYGAGYRLPYFSKRVETEIEFTVDNENKLIGVTSESSSEISVPLEGKINGFIDIDLISFIKSYSSYPQINSEGKTEIIEGKLDIQYTGLIDNENQAIYGDWLIEEKFINQDGFEDVEFFTGIWLLKRL